MNFMGKFLRFYDSKPFLFFVYTAIIISLGLYASAYLIYLALPINNMFLTIIAISFSIPFMLLFIIVATLILETWTGLFGLSIILGSKKGIARRLLGGIAKTKFK